MENKKNEKESKKEGGFLKGLLFGLAGVAVGVGATILVDSLAKDGNKKQEQVSYKNSNDKNKDTEYDQIKNNKTRISNNNTGNSTKNGEEQYETFFCPISGEIMKDPVITPHGITYDRQSILGWLSRNNTCPVTRNPLKDTELIPNYALRQTIDDYLTKNRDVLNNVK
jgi:hypothetical protein